MSSQSQSIREIPEEDNQAPPRLVRIKTEPGIVPDPQGRGHSQLHDLGQGSQGQSSPAPGTGSSSASTSSQSQSSLPPLSSIPSVNLGVVRHRPSSWRLGLSSRDRDAYLWANPAADIRDVTFLFGADATPVSASKYRLHTASQEFENLFRSNPAATVFRDEGGEAVSFSRMVEFIYVDNLPFESFQFGELFDLWCCAVRYGVWDLVEKAAAALKNKLTTENALTVLDRAVQFREAWLTEYLLEYIAREARSVFQQNAFLNLPQRSLNMILAREDLELDEFVILQRVMAWGRAQAIRTRHGRPVEDQEVLEEDVKPAELRDRLGTTLHLIRLPTLTAEQVMLPEVLELLAERDQVKMLKYLLKKDVDVSPYRKDRRSGARIPVQDVSSSRDDAKNNSEENQTDPAPSTSREAVASLRAMQQQRQRESDPRQNAIKSSDEEDRDSSSGGNRGSPPISSSNIPHAPSEPEGDSEMEQEERGQGSEAQGSSDQETLVMDGAEPLDEALNVHDGDAGVCETPIKSHGKQLKRPRLSTSSIDSPTKGSKHPRRGRSRGFLDEDQLNYMAIHSVEGADNSLTGKHNIYVQAMMQDPADQASQTILPENGIVERDEPIVINVDPSHKLPPVEVPNLETFSISYMQNSPTAAAFNDYLKNLNPCNNLIWFSRSCEMLPSVPEVLWLSETNIHLDINGVNVLTLNHNLEKVVISRLDKVASEVLRGLGTPATIKHLALDEVRLEYSDPDSVPLANRVPQLETLKLRQVKMFCKRNERPGQTGPVTLDFIRTCPQLRELSCDFVRMDNDVDLSIFCGTNLEKLALKGAKLTFTDQAVNLSAPAVKELYLTDCIFPHRSRLPLNSLFPNLEKVKLFNRNEPVSPFYVVNITLIRSLENLAVFNLADSKKDSFKQALDKFFREAGLASEAFLSAPIKTFKVERVVHRPWNGRTFNDETKEEEFDLMDFQDFGHDTFYRDITLMKKLQTTGDLSGVRN